MVDEPAKLDIERLVAEHLGRSTAMHSDSAGRPPTPKI